MLMKFFSKLFKAHRPIDSKVIENKNKCLENLFLASHYVLWELNLSNQKIIWQYHQPNFLGYCINDIPLSLDWWQQRIHPDDLQNVLQRMHNTLQNKDSSIWNISYRFQCQDGKYATLQSIANICLDASNQPVSLIACVSDRTSFLETDKTFQLLQQALNSVTNGIILVDMGRQDTPVIYVNPAFTHMTGYTSEEAIGKNCRFLQGTDRQQPELRHVREAIQQGNRITATLRNYRKDGGLFWNELHLSPIRNNQGVITHYVGVLHDITERKLMENLLLQQATHDHLTGIPNRPFLTEHITKELSHHSSKICAVLFMDLDRFKNANDKLGHGFGDILLKNVAERLEGILRETDIICRVGGDEFIMFCPNLSSPQEAQKIAERILQLFHQDFIIQNRKTHITTSIGISLYPKDGSDAETLIKHADSAMYVSKKLGRDRFEFYAE
jgi:diguanylate cyclase (GGDEF)-like protein/PAS domain S-box-containing protein